MYAVKQHRFNCQLKMKTIKNKKNLKKENDL